MLFIIANGLYLNSEWIEAEFIVFNVKLLTVIALNV